MARLIILRGLPASGKSTKAEQMVREYGNAVRINRDLLRTMLHFDRWSRDNEAITRNAAYAIAEECLRNARDGVVLVDDINLFETTVTSWKEVALRCEATCEVVRLETPMEECIARDAARERSVGRAVIVGMALEAGLYPKPAKGMIICDIDGTLADCAHRLHFVRQQPKEWEAFFRAMHNDTLRDEVLQLVLEYQERGFPIVLVSGRPEEYRETTERWLRFWCGGLDYEALFMRRTGDRRPDTVVKEEILKRYFPDLSWIHEVIDDRPSVLRMWRSHGLKAFDVGNGQEF